MRQVISVIGSLSVGLLMAAAGLYYDVKTLAVAGVILFGLAAVLWLYEWGKRPNPIAPVATSTGTADDAPVRRRAEILDAAYVALDDGLLAIHPPVEGLDIRRTLPKLASAILSLSKEFDLPLPRAKGSGLMDLQRFALYLEQLLPLLSAGHLEEAREYAQGLLDGEATRA